MTARFGARLGDGIVAAAVVVLFGWPVAACVAEAVGGAGADSAAYLTGSGHGLDLLRNTLRLVGLTEVFALPIGTALAWLLLRTDLPGRLACLAVLLFGAFIPLPLQALAWLGGFGNLGRQQALGSSPWLVGWPAAAFVHAVAALPWVVLIVGVGLCMVEPELEEAARLHWPTLRVALRITLRRAWGAIGAAGLLVAALAATDMTVTDLIPLRTYAEESYLLSQLGIDQGQLIVRATLPQALVLGGGTAALALWLARLDLRRLAGVNRPRWQVNLGRARIPLAVAVMTFLALLIGLPLEGLIWRAGRVGSEQGAGGPHWSLGGLAGSLSGAWGDPVGLRVPLPGSAAWWGLASTAVVTLAWVLARIARLSFLWRITAVTLFISLAVLLGTSSGAWGDLIDGARQALRAPLPVSTVWSSVAATLSVALAWTLAWRARHARAWRVATLALFVLALATPGPIVGLALKQAYVGIGLWNRTPALLVMSTLVRSLPYSLMFLVPVLWSWPRGWEEEARMAGLGTWRQAGWLALPLTWAAVAVAWLFAFVYGLGELPAAYLTYAPGYDLVSLLVWSLLHTGVESRLAAIALVLLAVLAVPAVATLLLVRRQMTVAVNRAP